MTKTRYAAVFAAVLYTLGAAALASGTDVSSQVFTAAGERFRVVQVAGSLEHPWALAFLPGGGYLVTERPGRLVHISPDGSRQRVEGLPAVHAAGQGGLLDLALHPGFSTNSLVYWTYSVSAPGGSATALARGRLDGTRLRDVQVLWTMQRATAPTVHYGSRIIFAPDGYLYLATGDRGAQERSRNPGDAAGKVIRLRDDGSIPQDNPFANRTGVLPELFTLGHRNIQGLAVHPDTGQIWLTEHGPRGGDELNRVIAGADYGWPLTTHGVAYSGARIAESPNAPGIEPPVTHWTPSIAPSGLAFYRGNAFPSWQGALFSGSLAGQKLVLIRLDGDRYLSQTIVLDGTVGRIRDVRVSAEGFVYILTDDRSGRLLRLEPAR